MSDDVSKAEFSDWKNQIVTQAVFKKINDAREATVEHMLFGGTVGDNTGEDTARAVGVLQGLDMLLGIDWE